MAEEHFALCVAALSVPLLRIFWTKMTRGEEVAVRAAVNSK